MLPAVFCTVLRGRRGRPGDRAHPPKGAWTPRAWVDGAADSLGTRFVGLSTLMAGWAITSAGALSSTLGWFGVVPGVVGVAAFFAPAVELAVLPVGSTPDRLADLGGQRAAEGGGAGPAGGERAAGGGEGGVGGVRESKMEESR